MIVHSNGYTFGLTYAEGHYRATCCRTGREKLRLDLRVWLNDQQQRVLDAGLIADRLEAITKEPK